MLFARTSTVLTDLNLATRDFYKQIVRVISQDNFINKRLLANSEGIDGGESITIPLEYGTTDIQAMGEYDSINLKPNEILDYANFAWTHINGTLSLSEKKVKIQNRGKAQMLKLLKIHAKNLANSMKQKFSTMLFATTHEANDNMSSLYDICADTTAVVGGLDPSLTDFNWTPRVLNLVSASLTYANIILSTNDYFIEKILRKMVGALGVAGDKPTLIVTTQVVWDAYEAVLREDKRFEGNHSADAGFDILTFRGIPMVVDANVPAGYMYFLNESYLGYYHATGFNFNTTPFKRAEMQHVYFSELNWWGGFGVSRRDKQGAVLGMPSDYTNLTLS